MTAVTGRDFELYQGTTRQLDVLIIDAAALPVDLSAVTAIDWQMAANAWAVPVIIKSLADGITITDEPGGMIAIALLPVDTESLPCGRYYHECRITEDTHITKVFTGHVTLLRDMI